MSGSSPVRIAILGAGLIGEFHAQIAVAADCCELVGIADPTPAGTRVAELVGVPSFTDHRELLERVRPEGVIVAVPNALHAPVGRDCAAAGVPMLVEKPVTDTLEAARGLLDATDAAGVAVATGHHRRFDPAAERARAMLSDGALGTVLAVQCLWSARKPDDYFEAAGGWRRQQPGGGPTLINLIHEVDMMRYLCGDIVRVYAETGHTARRFDVEDSVAVTLRFASGALGTITASDAAPSPWTWEQATGENPHVPFTGRNSYRILGTEGSLGYPRLDLWRHENVATGCWWDTIEATPQPVGERAAIARQLVDFCAVVRGEGTPRVSGNEGFATLAATTAILDSAATGLPVVPESR